MRLHVQRGTNQFHNDGQIREQTTRRICERGQGMENGKGKSDLTNSSWEGAWSCTHCICFLPLYGSILEMWETVTLSEWTRKHKCNHNVKSFRHFSSFSNVFTPFYQSGIAKQVWPFPLDMLSLFPPCMRKLRLFTSGYVYLNTQKRHKQFVQYNCALAE